jgi:glycosyltransferase involved in cell wall biosynthesis
MIRVALAFSMRRMWQGGISYFHNLLSCYQKHPDHEIKLIVFTPFPEDVELYQSDAIEIHSYPRPPWDYPRRIIKRLLGYDDVLTEMMEHYRIDLLTHFTLGRQTQINTLQWMPDFQHKAMPQFFSSKECARRDSSIANVQLWGNILLSSHSAASDFRRYYPDLASVQTHILHFSSGQILNVDLPPREEIAAHYPIRSPYFFLPNQFWQHKNHGTVIEALRQTAQEIRVICTGPMRDSRNAAYVPNLLKEVRKAGLEQRFICLGTVSYAMLAGLMHHSIAVLQPSFFEGWSTSVEESKAMRKQIILSNIAVHLEQAPKRGVYFSPDSAENLADCLNRVYAEFDPATEAAYAKQRPLYKTKIEQDWIGDFAQIMKSACQPRFRAKVSGISQKART